MEWQVTAREGFPRLAERVETSAAVRQKRLTNRACVDGPFQEMLPVPHFVDFVQNKEVRIRRPGSALNDKRIVKIVMSAGLFPDAHPLVGQGLRFLVLNRDSLRWPAMTCLCENADAWTLTH